MCARYAGLDVVRAMENDPVGYPDKFWEQLAELGLLGMTLPEEYGGSGMTMLDAMVVYTELGRALAPSPHFVSSVMSGGVILGREPTRSARSGSPRSGGRGDRHARVAGTGRGFGPDGVQLRAEADGDGWRLTGTKRHVQFASAADRLLVLARTADGPDVLPRRPERRGHHARAAAHDLVGHAVRGRLRQCARSTPTRWSASRAARGRRGTTTMHDGIILLAAQAVGGAQYAHAIAAQYAKDRHQFDKPLGAFQALAHYLSDAVTAVDGAETLVWEAAWARSDRPPDRPLAPMAKLFACRTFRDVTATAQQIFGGVGFTLEYDIQLYFRRAKQLQISWWNDRYLEELVAAEVLDAPALLRAAQPDSSLGPTFSW